MNTEIGLKTQIARQVGLKNFQNDLATNAEKHLLQAWSRLPANVAEELIWDYVLTAPATFWKSCDSALLGIFTEIKMYTNKAGKQSPAHFSCNGTYIGSAKKLGSKRIGYVGNFPIDKKNFEVNYSAVATAKTIQGLFQPHPYAAANNGRTIPEPDSDSSDREADCDSEDEELGYLVKKAGAKKAVAKKAKK